MAMEIDERIKCLNHKNKIMICLSLGSKSLSLTEIVREIENNFNIKVYRVTIYRSLEGLRKLGIIEKEKSKENGKVKYSLKITNIQIDYLSQKFIFK